MNDIELLISIIGFNKKTVKTSIKKYEVTKLDIFLEESAIPTETVIITAGKHEQLLKEIPVSVNVVEANALLARNIQTIDDALRYIPGVNMTEYQVNIRGSSGYSRGVGNRVLMLLDGLPLLSGDTGEMKFDAIPISQVDRVEVVKGAGSTLYGTSALGGVINILTKDPAENANVNIKLFSGLYDSPTYPEWKWSDKMALI
jgi:iron complex outermembrane receptor protein